ncbi:MAG TPA: methyltransferase domain-containing protein [Anaerolineae bacterium]|nr:methyltransferase domain-containing protein [Anaerolineae bacterium]
MSTKDFGVIFDDFAADYERTRVPRFRPFVKKLLQLYDTRPGSHVLDAGCGTGLAGTLVAPRVGHGGQVLGLDASERMLEIARHKAQGFGFTQCEFVLGDVTQMDLPDKLFDLVISSFALWGEPHVIFDEFHRVLNSHGVLLLQHWGAEQSAAAHIFHEALERFATAKPHAHLKRVRELLALDRAQWADMNSPDAFERALVDAGFARAAGNWFADTVHFASLDELIEYHSVGARSRLEIAAMDEQTRAEFDRAIRDALRPLETPRGIDVEMRAIQVIARKTPTN